MSDPLPPPVGPPTYLGLLEVFRRTVPVSFFEPLLTGEDGKPTPAFALFRAIAQIFAQVGRAGNTSIQARYYLPSALQTAPPATSGFPATGEVVLDRVGDASDALVVAQGRMIIEGPGGRRYVNASEVIWNPGDVAPRTVVFASQILGFAGNLDFLADENGLVDLDLVQIADQSFDKAAPGGSALILNDQSVIQDTGFPDIFTDGDVGLYLKINASDNPENVNRKYQVVGFDWPELEIPVGSGRYPRRDFLGDVVRRNPVEVLSEVGGVYTDYYDQAVDELTTADIPLLPDPPAVGDAFYFGFTSTFQGVTIRFDQPGEGDWELAWEYWDGAAWQPLPNLDDLTNAFRPPFPGFESCTWDVPPDWAAQLSPTGSGLTLFFVRARLSVFTDMTVQPLAGRIVFFHYEPVIPSVYPPGGDITWAMLDFRESNLGLKIAQAQAFSGGRDDDLYILGDERGVYQQPFETDDVFRERAARLADVVSPLAIIQAINRALRPLGFQGDAIDVTIDNTEAQNLLGAGFTGLFFDLPAELAPSPPGILAAFDLYAPGDENPQNPWLVTQSLEEAYGWFLVLLPWLGEGDFGIFLDEGPLYWDEAAQVYYGPSFFGFIDGFPIDGYATYSAIYNTIEPIKAGGGGFTMIGRENPTVPVEC